MRTLSVQQRQQSSAVDFVYVARHAGWDAPDADLRLMPSDPLIRTLPFLWQSLFARLESAVHGLDAAAALVAQRRDSSASA